MTEEDKESLLLKYWKENIKTNYKKISAIFGSMIIMVLGLVFYGIRTGLDFFSIGMTIIFALNPFITILINIMFKGESELKDREIGLLTQELKFAREISEWQLKVVALRSSADWDKYNELIKEVEIREENKT